MSSLIELVNVCMDFGEKQKFRVLKEINLQIGAGEILAVVGESGCGKTTLGKLIANIHQASHGTVIYKGKKVADLSKAEYKQFRTDVQMVHQDSFAALNPNKTIFQSLSGPILYHKIVKDKQAALVKCTEYLEEVGLTPVDQYLFKYPHQLSGGQRQRILLARALLMKPKLIVADEPVSMVDVSLRISLLDLMAKMNQKHGISFVYITHDLATARYMANNGRVMVMYLGSIVELNEVNEAISHPKHPYFQALLQAVPVANPHHKKMIHKLPLKSMEIPDINHLPTGCQFHPRCLYATDVCKIHCPSLRKLGTGLVACHHSERIVNAYDQQIYK